jgi:hypothetical protein
VTLAAAVWRATVALVVMMPERVTAGVTSAGDAGATATAVAAEAVVGQDGAAGGLGFL